MTDRFRKVAEIGDDLLAALNKHVLPGERVVHCAMNNTPLGWILLIDSGDALKRQALASQVGQDGHKRQPSAEETFTRAGK